MLQFVRYDEFYSREFHLKTKEKVRMPFYQGHETFSDDIPQANRKLGGPEGYLQFGIVRLMVL